MTGGGSTGGSWSDGQEQGKLGKCDGLEVWWFLVLSVAFRFWVKVWVEAGMGTIWKNYSFASTSLENGDDAKTVQENLGHHNAAFTQKQYGHVKKQWQLPAPSEWRHTYKM